MKKQALIGLRTVSLVVFAAFFVGLLAVEGFAQGTRRKRTPTTTTVPAANAGEAQIISRAEDFPDTDSMLIPKPETKKTPEPVSDPNETAKTVAELRSRVTGLESSKKDDQDEKQKRLLLNLDILTRAEQRSESLRKQLFEMVEKESTIKARLDIIEINIRPEAIEREVAHAGTMRPEDLRALKKKQLEIERTSLQSILAEIQKTRTVLDQNLQRSELMVEKLRVRLEKEIDSALADDPSKPF
jgi:hypothetical protein